MPSLVIGGTGFIGSWITRELLAKGETVFATCRRGLPRDAELAALPVKWVAADVLDPPSIRYAMENCEYVYDASGAISMGSQQKNSVYETNYVGAMNVLKAAKDMRIKRLTRIGSIFGLGSTKKDLIPVNESAEFNLKHFHIPYFRAKRDIELAIPQFLDEGLNVVSVFPGFCSGPNDAHISSSQFIVAALQNKIPGYFKGGICQIDVRDAAEGMIQAMYHGKTGEKYLVTGYNITYKEIMQTLAKVTGRRLSQTQLPLGMVELFCRSFDFIGSPYFNTGMALILQRTWWYDDTKAKLEFGAVYRSLESSYTDAIRWFLHNKYLTPAQAGKIV